MISSPFRFAGCAFVLIFVLEGAYGDDSVRRQMLVQRLDEQDRWLGDGENSLRWRGWLHNEELRELLKSDADPDPAKVAEILDLYQSGVRGLNHRRFARVRRALRRWMRELPLAPLEQLPERISSEQDAFVAISETDIEASHARLTAAFDRLDAYLTPGDENGRAWKDYLLWDDLQEQLRAGPIEAKLGLLDAVDQRLQSYYEGLELDVFVDASRALDQFIDLRLAVYGENPKKDYQTKIDALSKVVAAYKAEPSGEEFDEITGLVGWLDRRRQSPRLLRQIRRNFTEPNLVIEVSEGLVDAGMGRGVDECDRVTDCILGTAISGSGHTTGKVHINLVSNEEVAVIETVFVGNTRTLTVGVNGPAQIDSAGNTRFEASKRLLLDAGGLRYFTAQCDAQTSTQTLGVSSRRRLGGRLIQRIASRKVAEQKGTGERIASGHAATQIGDRMDAQVAQQLSGDRAGLLDRLRAPLVRRNALPQQLDFSTTDDALRVVWLQAMAGIGAPTPSPVVEGKPDLAVRVHESMLNNLATDMLAGYTLSEEDIRKLFTLMDAELPEQLQPIEGKESWSITFARIRPVTVRFWDDRIAVTVRGRRFTSGDKSYPRPMNIEAAYRVVVTGSTVRLVRDGDVVVLPPNFREGQRLSIRDTALRNLLIRRFGKMLDAEFVVHRIALPEQFGKSSSLLTKHFQSNQGWLSSDWTLDRTTPEPQDDAIASSVAAGR